MIEVLMICDVCRCEGHLSKEPSQRCIDAMREERIMLVTRRHPNEGGMKV